MIVPMGALRYQPPHARTQIMGSGHPSNFRRVYQAGVDRLPKEVLNTIPRYALVREEYVTLGGLLVIVVVSQLSCVFNPENNVTARRATKRYAYAI